MYSARAWVGFDHILAAVIYRSVFKERVHLAVRGKFFSKTLVSLGKTDEVMVNLTAIVSVLSGFKEKVMSNILNAAMR